MSKVRFDSGKPWTALKRFSGYHLLRTNFLEGDGLKTRLAQMSLVGAGLPERANCRAWTSAVKCNMIKRGTI